MTKNPFDSFSKQLLEEVLLPFGSVQISREVPGESQYIDVYFEPSDTFAITPPELGLLGRIAQAPCLLEPFRNQPTITAQAEAEEELIMVLTQAYLEWEQQTEQRGEQTGILRSRL